MSDKDNNEEKHEKPIVVRNSTDLQRLKLEKLMKNPEKPVVIPERPKERGMPIVPDFVRNVMGSSAGAGSGEFHVYRHLRRKEYARQKYMKEKGERERIEDEYHGRIEENKKKAEEKTAKKRAKRLKRKQKVKGKIKKAKITESKSESSDDSNASEDKEDDEDSCVINEVKGANENGQRTEHKTVGIKSTENNEISPPEKESDDTIETITEDTKRVVNNESCLENKQCDKTVDHTKEGCSAKEVEHLVENEKTENTNDYEKD